MNFLNIQFIIGLILIAYYLSNFNLINLLFKKFMLNFDFLKVKWILIYVFLKLLFNLEIILNQNKVLN